MNTPSPLPQGITPPKERSKVQIAVFSILAVHLVVIGGMMMQGCKDNTPPPAPPVTQVEPPVTNPVVVAPIATNPIAPVATNPIAHVEPVAPIAPIVPPPIDPVAPVGATKEYVIAKGDTLGAVAKKYHVSLKSIQDANPGIVPTKLKIGDKVKIPESTTTTPTTSTTGDTTAVTGDTATYTVKSGDALEKIAKKNGTTVKAIVELNHLKSMNSIKAGQKLKLPASKTAASSTTTTPEVTAPPPVTPTAPPVTVPPPTTTGATTN